MKTDFLKKTTQNVHNYYYQHRVFFLQYNFNDNNIVIIDVVCFLFVSRELAGENRFF